MYFCDFPSLRLLYLTGTGKFLGLVQEYTSVRKSKDLVEGEKITTLRDSLGLGLILISRIPISVISTAQDNVLNSNLETDPMNLKPLTSSKQDMNPIYLPISLTICFPLFRVDIVSHECMHCLGNWVSYSYSQAQMISGILSKFNKYWLLLLPSSRVYWF